MDQEKELLLDHLKSAYSNVQETIRFVDTKTAFITGLSTLAFSFPAWLPAGFEATSSQALRPFLEGLSWWRWVIIAMPLLSAISGFICLAAAIFSVIPRKPREKISPTVLFAFEPSPKWHWRKAVPWVQRGAVPESLFDTAWQNLTSRNIEDNVFDEYRMQLKSTGQILGRKIVLQQWAGKCLLGQMVFLVLFMVFLGVALLPASAGDDQDSSNNLEAPHQSHEEIPASEMTSPSIPTD